MFDSGFSNHLKLSQVVFSSILCRWFLNFVLKDDLMILMGGAFSVPRKVGCYVMSEVRVDENEPFERALKRFKKECQRSGILQEVRRREHFEKPSVKKKRKIEAARRKIRRKQMKMRRRIDAF